jgi:hypothetical protein
MPRRRRLLLAASLALSWSCAAFAHAIPRTEEPPPGATVAVAPASVTITFSESVDPRFSRIVVENAAAQRVDDGRDTLDPHNKKRLRVGLKQPVAPGSYTVIWYALSTDGHRTEGRYRFSVTP